MHQLGLLFVIKWGCLFLSSSSIHQVPQKWIEQNLCCPSSTKSYSAQFSFHICVFLWSRWMMDREIGTSSQSSALVLALFVSSCVMKVESSTVLTKSPYSTFVFFCLRQTMNGRISISSCSSDPVLAFFSSPCGIKLESSTSLS